ncbi:dipeptide epimerase [Oculatella sp. LEGE 06141]|uniref:dipeptide epimerase n=1 Tax=Oculatella sp. LEGE 06141 TaxID=1828648 RepID=UPI00187F2DB8|nr:dipeptide epimerase [Oculatella sp. LEGE 06141]MBE9177664.1 dipeptide epimerase [Oculatella sp. LEGE 06141]
MKIHVHPFTVHKRFPLTISRGTSTKSTNLWLILEHDGLEGWGEASPFSVGQEPQTVELLMDALRQSATALEALSPFDQQQIEHTVHTLKLPSAARTAIDLAVQDWLGKRVDLPLWKLWGGDRSRIVPTSVTIGINTPAAAQQRLRDWQQVLSVRAIKVKLGSPAGIEADQAMLTAIQAEAPSDATFSVDANGGWSLADAIRMSHWLAAQNVTYIEQPLPQGQEADLLQLYQRSPLPIFVDESCFTSRDIPQLADRVHGINIKLMKSGGLTEARRMISTAKACGLQIMYGCYSDSTLANTAAAQLAPFADYLDLDSHLNLTDDPFEGAIVQNGCLLPNDLPGLGVQQSVQQK